MWTVELEQVRLHRMLYKLRPQSDSALRRTDNSKSLVELSLHFYQQLGSGSLSTQVPFWNYRENKSDTAICRIPWVVVIRCSQVQVLDDEAAWNCL